VVKADSISAGGFLGQQIGHIEMSNHESLRLQTDFDFWVADQMLRAGGWRAPS